MTKIKKGNIIFHSCKHKIVAISIAKDRYIEADRPKEMPADQWNRKRIHGLY